MNEPDQNVVREARDRLIEVIDQDNEDVDSNVLSDALDAFEAAARAASDDTLSSLRAVHAIRGELLASVIEERDSLRAEVDYLNKRIAAINNR